MKITGFGQRLLRLDNGFGLPGIQFAVLGIKPLDQLCDQPFEPVQPRLAGAAARQVPARSPARMNFPNALPPMFASLRYYQEDDARIGPDR